MPLNNAYQMSDDPDMTQDRHNMPLSEHAIYSADLVVRCKNYVSGALKNDSYIYVSKAATAGGAGAVTFYITNDGTSGGTAVFNNVYADSVAVTSYGANGNFQASNPVVAGDKKSVTITISQITTVLGLLTFNTVAANGIDCRLYVMGD